MNINLPKGNLIYIGRKKLGLDYYNWYECITCKTPYPELAGGVCYVSGIELAGGISCNGVSIVVCPYCGPDSAANAKARGDHLKRAA